jgi:hypothetical protein
MKYVNFDAAVVCVSTTWKRFSNVGRPCTKIQTLLLSEGRCYLPFCSASFPWQLPSFLACTERLPARLRLLASWIRGSKSCILSYLIYIFRQKFINERNRGNLNYTNFTLDNSIRSKLFSLRVISYWSSVTTRGNLTKVTKPTLFILDSSVSYKRSP